MKGHGLDSLSPETKISAVIFDLDGTLLDTEKAAEYVLEEFLAKYGKELDSGKEDKRSGMGQNKSVATILEDYDLPVTASEFVKEVMPLYMARFLEAAKRMGADAAHCLVIEDSLVGVRAAKNAGMKVVAVPSSVRQADRYSIADCVLHSLLEFQPELWGFPAFEDWVQNALPIEPLYIKCLLSGITHDSSVPLSIIPDRASAKSLPDQVSGVYFGWAILSTHGIFKAVMSIGWDLRTGIANRVIQTSLVGEFAKDTSGEQLEFWIVGYIRQLRCEANVSAALEIFPEDKSNAEAALDLPMFSYQLVKDSMQDQ